jgi:hypothetical protein
MPESSSFPDADHVSKRYQRRMMSGMPRWVKVFLIIFIALVVLFVILHLTGNGFGDHMHMSALEHGAVQP